MLRPVLTHGGLVSGWFFQGQVLGRLETPLSSDFGVHSQGHGSDCPQDTPPRWLSPPPSPHMGFLVTQQVTQPAGAENNPLHWLTAPLSVRRPQGPAWLSRGVPLPGALGAALGMRAQGHAAAASHRDLERVTKTPRQTVTAGMTSSPGSEGGDWKFTPNPLAGACRRGPGTRGRSRQSLAL